MKWFIKESILVFLLVSGYVEYEGRNNATNIENCDLELADAVSFFSISFFSIHFITFFPIYFITFFHCTARFNGNNVRKTKMQYGRTKTA